jgi:putative transposase
LANPQTKKNQTGGRPIPGFSMNKNGQKIEDKIIKVYLLDLINDETDVYGYRKLTLSLRRKYRLVINKKKVYRLCKELDILMPQREKKHKYPRRLAKNQVITGSNQLWQLDIKYGYVSSSRRFFYLASAIDVHDRSIVGHYRGTFCTANHITKMLQKALIKRGIYELEEGQSLIIRTDNGPQFLSKNFQGFCETQRVVHERIPPSSPNLNAYIESFHSVLERECYQRNEFITFDDAFQCVDKYIKFYNERRYHGSLNDYAPEEYYQKWLAGEVNSIKKAM